jgi:hypothetical protein
MKFIENLRGAPDETKKSFAIAVSVIFTMVIVVFSLAVSNPLSGKKEKDVAKTTEDKLPSPFSVLASQIGSSFGGLKNDLLPLKEMLLLAKKEIASSTPSSVNATSTVSVIATTTVQQSSTQTKTVKVVPKPAPVVSRIEPKYGPFLIPGVKVKKVENMGASAMMTIGKTITTDSTGSPQAKTTQASSTTEIKTTTSTQN